MTKDRTGLLLGLAVGIALGCGAAAAQEYSFKFQSSDPAGNPNFELQQGWTKDLAERTGGRVSVELLPVGSIVEHNETQDAIAAGILDGWSATTHWAAAEFLAQRYPDVQVDADSLYIDHGDVLTSAGTASAIDASLHIVRSELGSDVATYIARFLVVAPHRDGGQAQYIHRPIVTLEASPLGDTISWALGHLDQPLTVEALAERSAMSPRNFSRRFREITGLSPARWLRMQRLDEARRLLEVTTWPIARVAAECGFLSVVTFRQNFVARYGTTPTIYRSRFSGP